jgi:hypothetical protein
MRNTIINKQVQVTAMGFKKNLVAYPRQMEFDGTTYDFIDAGIGCMVRSGERIAQILTLTDGSRHFKMRSDNRGGVWTLLSMSS